MADPTIEIAPAPAMPAAGGAPSEGVPREPGSDDVTERRARIVRQQLRTGLRIGQVVLVFDDTGARHVVRLLGRIDGFSLIVSNPLDEGRLLFVPEGRGVTVRLFDGRDLSQFHASVLKSVTQPHPHLHLSMPSQASQRIRVKPDYAAEIALKGALRYGADVHFAHQVETLIAEISGAGALCVAARPLPSAETRVRVLAELPLAADKPKIDVEASIVHREPIELDGERAEALSLQFERLSEVNRYRLRALAAETLLGELLAQRSRRG